MTTSLVKVSLASTSLTLGEVATPPNTTGAFLVATSESSTSITVASVAVGGTANWQKKLSWSTDPITASNGVLLATNSGGASIVVAHGSTYSQVTKLDSSGNVVWSRKVVPRVCVMNILSDGSAIVGAASASPGTMSDILAVKLATADGSTSWAQQLIDDDIAGVSYTPPSPMDGTLFHGAPVELSSGDIVFAHHGARVSSVPSRCVTKLTSAGAISWTRRMNWESVGYPNHWRVQLGAGSGGELWVAHGFLDTFGIDVPSVSFLKLNTSTGAILAAHKLRADFITVTGVGDYSCLSTGSTLSVLDDGRVIAAGVVGDETVGYPGTWTKPSASPTGASAVALPYLTPAATPSAYFKQTASSNSAARLVGGFLDTVAGTVPLIVMSTTAVDGTGDDGGLGFSQTRATGLATYDSDTSTTTSVTLTVSTGTGSLANTASTATSAAGGLTFAVPGGGFPATGFSSTAFGTPAYTFLAPATGASFPTGFGTPVRVLNRTLAASGAAPSTAFGAPEAGLAFAAQSSYRPVGFTSTAFGTPAGTTAFTAAASGAVSTALGVPTMAARGAVTGLSSTAFGTALGGPKFGVFSVSSTLVGTPTFTLVAKPVPVASSKLGTPRATWRITAGTTGSVLTVFGSAQAHLHFNPRSAVFRTSFGSAQATGT